MRTSIFNILLVLLFTSVTYSQSKDFRAELDVQGTVNELSISPDNSIWLATAVGNTYYTKNVYSTWHSGPLSFYKPDDYLNHPPSFDRVTFFNKDIALITGYISSDTTETEETEKYGLFRTENGGKQWDILNIGDDGWIYCVFADKSGHAWSGGSSGNIMYSDNFGRNWKRLASPFKNNNRIHRIFMKNNNEGIAGALGNFICYTNDNWKTCTNISTPFDQKLYKSYSDYDDNRIENICYWKDYIICCQGKNAFYTDRKEISWQKFPVKIYNFEIDNKTGDIWAVSRDLHVVRFSTPIKYTIVNSTPLSKIPSCTRVINGSLYAYYPFENEIYKVNENEFFGTYLFTTDHKIDRPGLTKKYGNTIWGINGQHLYISNTNKGPWYREYIFPAPIEDLKLLDSRTAILWDGLKDEEMNSVTDRLKKNINISELYKILNAENSAPSRLPLLKEFNITEKDKADYIKLCSNNLKEDRPLLTGTKYDNVFYENMADQIDTLSVSSINKILNKDEGIISTTHQTIEILLVNSNKDTLKFSRRYYENSGGWHLPWNVRYDGLNFRSYSIEFSKFIRTLLPDEFLTVKYFQNSYFIYQAANYFYMEKMKAWNILL